MHGLTFGCQMKGAFAMLNQVPRYVAGLNLVVPTTFGHSSPKIKIRRSVRGFGGTANVSAGASKSKLLVSIFCMYFVEFVCVCDSFRFDLFDIYGFLINFGIFIAGVVCTRWHVACTIHRDTSLANRPEGQESVSGKVS